MAFDADTGRIFTVNSQTGRVDVLLAHTAAALTSTPDGSHVVVANEGEPNVGYTLDPEGSVSVIRVSDFSVSTVGFAELNVGGPRHAELPLTRMVLGGVGASVAQDLEPEYVAISEDGREAYVSLQETAGMDLGPEGFVFVPAEQSPDGRPKLIVGSEVSGTTSVYDIAVTSP